MTPRATMRLQFHKGFAFADAARIVPYMESLGVSHLYASPIAAARAGSMHGYDVIDPTRVNPELGFAGLSTRCAGTASG
jgi:(1->4)-alpha-D-glucan 1-alpha-D-glucosylmutase